MTEKQYVKASLLAYVTEMLVMFYMLFTFIGVIAFFGTRPSVLVEIVATIAGIAGASFGFFVKKGTRLGAQMIVSAPTGVFFIVSCFNSSPTTFVLAFPIIFAAFVFLDKKMILFENVVLALGVIIHAIRLFSSQIIDKNFAFVEITITLVCVIVSGMAVSLVSGFSKENMGVIEENAKDQISKAQAMTNAAESLMTSFDEVNKYMGQVNDCIVSSNFSMENIAQSTESTADAIQQQATMCSEINIGTQSADARIKEMHEATEGALGTVREGVAVINSLKAQSDTVNEASQVTVQSTIELTRKISEVENITTAILNISSQTNLLALNASIEAARAGEAGKGFAVVADEIRQLSEQTKDSVNQITDIINQLNENAHNTNRSVEETISSVEKQAEMIDTTQEKFNDIATEVQSLEEIVQKTEEVMKRIFEGTNIISDNISQLSATSQQVAASSTESLNTSQEAVSAMDEVKNILESLNTIAEEIKSYA